MFQGVCNGLFSQVSPCANAHLRLNFKVRFSASVRFDNQAGAISYKLGYGYVVIVRNDACRQHRQFYMVSPNRRFSQMRLRGAMPTGRLYLVSAIFDANFLSSYEINDKEARSQ